MTIPYALDTNPLTGKGDYFARVRSTETADLEKIAERIVARGSTVGKTDVIAVLNLLIEVCIEMILDGQRIHLGGLVRLYCSIEGRFEAYDDAFNPRRHRLRGVAQAGPRLQQALKRYGQPRKQALRRPRPIPQQFTDVISGAHDRLTPGGVGQLTGARLKFNPAAADEGIFLIDEAGQASRVQVVAQNTPRQLIFGLPDLPAGLYHLEVRSRVGNASTLSVSRLDQPLRVT